MAVSAQTHWIQGIGFEVEVRGHHVFTDGKKEVGGKDRGPTPKEYVLAGLCGCTGMDVVSLMKKYKVDFKTFDVSAETEQTKEHPVQFTTIQVKFEVTGESLDPELIKKSVELSMTKYCGVSAMLSKAVPIHYDIYVNQQNIHSGKAQFE